MWGVAVVPVALLLGLFWPGARDHFRRLTSLMLRLYFASLWGLRVHVERPNGASNGPRILVANHQSFLDPLLLLSLEPGLSGPARDYVFRVPLLASVMRLLGFVEVGVHDAEGYEEVARRGVTASSGVLFFPEGTRTRTGDIGAFERGAFRLAVSKQVAVQPVVIDGFFQLLPPGSFFTRRHGNTTIRVVYLEPVMPPEPRTPGDARHQARRLAEEMRARMQRELIRQRALLPEDEMPSRGSALEAAGPSGYCVSPASGGGIDST